MSETTRDSFVWNCEIRVDKFHGDVVEGQEPYETILTDNMLMYGGSSAIWECLSGNGTATAAQALTFFNAANAAIGVGDSTTAAAATQTNLQGTNRLRKGMNAGFPAHTDGVVVGAKTIQYQATFGTSEANWAWQEVATFNSAVDATGRMLNRKVESLGTKTSASSWQVTVSIALD